MDFQKLSRSKWFVGLVLGIGALIVLLFAFQAGMAMGYRKAAFSYRWGADYYRAFGERREGPFGFMDDLPSSHGTAGQILKITLPSLVVEGPDKVEHVVVVTNDTVIRRFRDEIQASDLRQGDTVVVVGSPDAKSQIEAQLIRVMPPPPGFSPLMTPQQDATRSSL